MNVVVSSFPLLHLPNNARMHVLRTMNRFESINFSFCSKATKTLVKSLDLKAEYVEVFFFYAYLEIQIELEDSSEIRTKLYYRNYGATVDIRNSIPSRINSFYAGTGGRIEVEYQEKDRVRITNWMNHYSEVLHHSAIGFHFRSLLFDIESIREAFKGFSLRRIELDMDYDFHTQRILKELHPKKLRIHLNPFKDVESTQRFLIGNFDYIYLGGFPLELENLLMINSSVVDIWHSKLSIKDLNIFVKHWIEGSNKRLQYLYVSPKNKVHDDMTDFDEHILFNGVEYQTAPAEQLRIFNKTIADYGYNNAVEIKGGYDFERKDGTKATITYRKEFPIFKMFVWP